MLASTAGLGSRTWRKLSVMKRSDIAFALYVTGELAFLRSPHRLNFADFVLFWISQFLSFSVFSLLSLASDQEIEQFCLL